jgi:hypothetical protein
MKNLDFFLENYSSVNLSWVTVIPPNFHDAQPYKNFGDELSLYINQKLFPNVKFNHCHFDSNKTRIVSIGTILHNFYNGQTLVWGTGMDSRRINPHFGKSHFEIFAVRGVRTKKILETFGIRVPSVYGDPAILLPNLIDTNTLPVKKYKIGIIPHCSNYFEQNGQMQTNVPCFTSDDPRVIIIGTKTKNDILPVLDDMLSCDVILSESIHGCIIADAFNIPNLFMSQRESVENTVLSTRKNNDLEHRYDDYISPFDIEKYQIIHDPTRGFDLNKISDLIYTHYTPVDFTEQSRILIENHPLNH